LPALAPEGMLTSMHEWALAEAVIEATASALIGHSPSSLRSVTVLIGELQAVDREIFQFALSQMVKEQPFAAAEFIVEKEPAFFQCGRCGHGWSLDRMRSIDAGTREAIHFLPESAHAFLRCPACGSPDYRIQKGRGVSIASISLEGGSSDD
jgi:hydrogenase nickel incorporation protein HypA/HybF